MDVYCGERDGFEAGGVEVAVEACHARFVFSGLGKIQPTDGEGLKVEGGALFGARGSRAHIHEHNAVRIHLGAE